MEGGREKNNRGTYWRIRERRRGPARRISSLRNTAAAHAIAATVPALSPRSHLLYPYSTAYVWSVGHTPLRIYISISTSARLLRTYDKREGVWECAGGIEQQVELAAREQSEQPGDFSTEFH